MNKCLTILLNVAMWDQHATPGGIFSLFVCIAGGMIYQQSPMRTEKEGVAAPAADDDAFKTDMSVSEDNAEDVSLLETGNTQTMTAKRRG